MANNSSVEAKERKELEELQELEQLTRLAEEEQKQKKQFEDQLQESFLESAKDIGSQALTTGEQLSSAALSAATLGLSEKPIAAIQAAIGGVPAEQMVERRRQMQQESPYTEMAGQFAGGLTGASGMAGKAIAKTVGETAEKIGATQAAQSLSKVLGPLSGPASSIAQGAAIGAAGAPIAAAQMGVEELSGLRKPEEVPSIGSLASTGAKVGAGIPAGLMMAGVLGAGAKKLGSVAMTTALGPNKSIRDAYLQQPKEVTEMIEEADRRAGLQLGEAVPGAAAEKGLPRTQVAEEIAAATEPKRLQLEKLKESKTVAQLDENRARVDFDQAVNDRKMQFAEQLRQKREEAGVAAKAKRDFYKTGITQELADDVKVAAEDLKRDVTMKSRKAYEILDATPGEANLANADIEIEGLKEGLMTKGKILGPVQKRVAGLIDGWANDIGEVVGTRVPGVGRVDAPGNVPFPMVKKIVQDIDTQLGYMSAPENRGKFSDLDRTYLLKIRRIIDSNIKGIPEYAELMSDVSQRRELLEDVSNLVGDEKKYNFVKRLSNSWTPGDPAQDIVARLGRATGRPFEEALVEYTAMKQTGASQAEMAKVIADLPESVALKKMERTMAIVRRKEAKPELAPEEYASWVKSQADVDAVNQNIQRVQSELQDVGSAGKAETAINFVTQAMRGINPKYRAEIEALRNMTGQDFERQIRAASTAEAMLRSYPGGSRRTMLFKAVGGAAAGLVGPFVMGEGVSATSMMVGSALGASLDIYGGRVTKQILDGYLKVQGIPTVQKLNAAFAPLPKELKSEILNSFTRSVMQSEKQSVPLSEQEVAVAKMEIRNSDYLSPLEKAKATMMLDKTGILDTGIAQKVMLSGIASNADEGRARAYNAIRAGGR